MDIDVFKLRCSTSIADCSLLTLEFGNIHLPVRLILLLKGTDHVGTFMGLKCVVYYANYRSGNQSSKIQVVP